LKREERKYAEGKGGSHGAEGICRTTDKKWAKEVKSNISVLYLAYKDDQVPWYAKLFTLLVVAYAFSPIDLISDFVPILGYLDDIILVPIGVHLALKMIPQEVLDDFRQKVQMQVNTTQPKN
jgi:uncharacterized membrane protein YkvA (DUF1232 family)